MISKTENDRLEAWKVFHLRNVEERAITEQKELSVVRQPCPSLGQSSCTTSRNKRSGSLSAKEFRMSSGKRLSFPLPGWMEELHLRKQEKSYSKSAHLPRYT